MFHVPGKYNGGEGPGYAWTQTQSEVELRAPLPAGAEGSVRCTFSARTLALSWADAAAPLDAELSALIAPDDCVWDVEEEAGAKEAILGGKTSSLPPARIRELYALVMETLKYATEDELPPLPPVSPFGISAVQHVGMMREDDLFD